MKKILSTLLAGVLVAATALTASAGMFVFDSSDSEYWDAALNMLDKTQKAFWMEDGVAADWSISVDANSVEYESNKLGNLPSGWYEVVLCNLGTTAEMFPDVSGKVAFTLRGDSTFTVKSENAKNAGAVACIVGNNCRAEEAVDEEGIVTAGAYQVTNMSVDYETLPMGMVSSDVAVRLVAQMADISIADSVAAITKVLNGELDLGLAHKNSAWVFLGTEEEYKANATRTDANTITGAGAVVATTATTTEAPAVEEAAPAATVATVAVAASGSEVPADSVFIAGEIIGSENGWDGTAASGRAAAFDGNVETFFDPATASVDWCGVDAGEEMILTKLVINSRTTYPDRFYGATIEASNDPEFEESVELFYSDVAAEDIVYIDYTDAINADENTGYRYFRYINYMSHGDVAEVEFYGKAKDGTNPTYGAAAEEPVVEEPVVEEPVVEEPVVEEPVAEEPVVEEPVAEEVVVEEVVVEEPVVEEPAEEVVEEVVEEAAQTFDFGVIAAVVALLSAAGYAISKKR